MTKSLVTLSYLTDDMESGVIEDEVACVCLCWTPGGGGRNVIKKACLNKGKKRVSQRNRNIRGWERDGLDGCER